MLLIATDSRAPLRLAPVATVCSGADPCLDAPPILADRHAPGELTWVGFISAHAWPFASYDTS